LRGAFAEHFDTPLYLDNDTNMLTQSEQWFGAQRDKTDFAVVTIENGVGMGLVINNQLFRGTHGIGLELGHTKVQLEGALCRCGQRGCLEAYLGDYALTREAAVALDIETSGPKSTEQLLEELGRQAKTGNASAQTIFHRAGSYLSVGLANVIQLFDPPLIILSSNQMQLEFLCTDQVFSKAQQLTLSKRSSSCEITICAWDDLVWARGATVPALAALTDTMIGGQPITS
jgi:predicted NBD/HSP70 family sugar kinase